jgi:uncharacterized protein (DUF1778 family)
VLKKERHTATMNFRVDNDIKDRIARAAAIEGQNFTEFVVTALDEKPSRY